MNIVMNQADRFVMESV